MKYPAKHKVAHEQLNFRDEHGFNYGFVEHKGDNINISKLGSLPKAKQVEGVTVVLAAIKEATKRLTLVGWYDNATVYREAQTLRTSAGGERKYQFRAKISDAHLIPVSERIFEVPMKPTSKAQGYMGQRNWYYPDNNPNYARFLESLHSLMLGQSPETVDQAGPPSDPEVFQEGQRAKAEITITVRNPKLVSAAKEEYGLNCQVCDFNFEDEYGDLGRGFIEVHHLIPISTRHSDRPSTVQDVRVLCANCHRMIHRLPHTMDLDELRRRRKRN